MVSIHLKQHHCRYKGSYDACNGPTPPGTPSMIEFYREIAPKLRRTFVFNGDSDPCVSYEGTRTAIERVGFKVTPGGVYRPWFFNAAAASRDFLCVNSLSLSHTHSSSLCLPLSSFHDSSPLLLRRVTFCASTPSVLCALP
jgi:hypothetical protein